MFIRLTGLSQVSANGLYNIAPATGCVLNHTIESSAAPPGRRSEPHLALIVGYEGLSGIFH